MPPYSSHGRTTSSGQPTTTPAVSTSTGAAAPQQSSTPATSSTSSGTTASTMSMPASKARHYSQLHAQLAQLNTHLGDTENLMRLTAAQAGDMRFLGGYVGGLFMGSAKVLGEEGVRAKEEQGKGKEGVVGEGERV